MFELHVYARRRGVEEDQCDAHQVRAARLPHRMRLTRARFNHTPTPLPHALTPPCLEQAMHHACLPCAVMMRLPKICSARHSSVNGRILPRKKVGMIVTVNTKYNSQPDMTQSHADDPQRSLLVIIALRVSAPRVIVKSF